MQEQYFKKLTEFTDWYGTALDSNALAMLLASNFNQ